MGMDIHMYITKFNNEANVWRWIKLYKDNIYDLDSPDATIAQPIGRDYMLFEDLKEAGVGLALQESDLKMLDEELVKVYNWAFKPEKDEFTGFFGATAVNFADLKLAAERHPVVRDYEAEDQLINEGKKKKPIWVESPLAKLVKSIEKYIDFADEFYCVNSEIKIIYWFDN